VTVTDNHGHAIGHGCARPQRPQPHGKRARPGPRDGPGPPPPGHGTGHTAGTRTTTSTGTTGTENTASTGFAFTAAGQPGPPGGYGTWRLSTGIPGHPDLAVALEPVAIDDCDHRHETKGHDPGITLRHLTQIRHATCTAPGCRRPAAQCDFDHSVPYEAGGRTCACNGGPKCRHHHRLKQAPRWTADQPTPGTVRWTTPAGRTYTTEPTRYPV
jgi:hypothetical protein